MLVIEFALETNTKEPDANTVEGAEEAIGEVRNDLGEDEVLVVFDSAH